MNYVLDSLAHIFWVPYFISVSGRKKYANSCLQHTNGAKSSEHFVNVFCLIQIPDLCTLRQLICEYNITDYTQYRSWVVLQVQFPIHFRHGSVINSTQISVRTACLPAYLSAHWQREAAIVVISLFLPSYMATKWVNCFDIKCTYEYEYIYEYIFAHT